MNKKTMATVIALALFAVASDTVYASGADMPWESKLDAILDSLTGPVSRVLGAMSIIGAGIGIAFSDGGSGLRKVLFVVLGLSITYAAVSWGLPFLGFGGGLAL